MPNNKPGTELVPYKKNKRGSSGILPILLAVLLVSGLTGLTWFLTRDGDAKASPGGIIVMPTGSGCDREKVATEAMIAQGFAQSDFVVGVDQIDWSAPEANERSATASFSSVTPTNAKALVEELRSDTGQAKAAVSALMDESGASKKMMLNAKNWIPVQFKVASAWDGNTAYLAGNVAPAGTRQSASGDVAWLFVRPDKCDGSFPAKEIVTAHRAGCGNPQRSLPRPSRPRTPPTPPSTGEVGKDHRLAPPTTVVVHCPPGQYVDRYTERCINPPETTTTTNGGQGDSGDGATNTTTPPTTTAPPPAPPTTSPPTTAPPPPTIPSL